jgi:hypothetical protein
VIQQLQESGSTVLDSNGDGRVYLGPTVVRQAWSPTQAVASAPATPIGTNLNPNSTFESGLNGWFAVQGTLTQSGAFPHTGTKSALLTTTAVGNQRAESNQFAVLPGITYHVDGWAYTPALYPESTEIQANWFDASHGYLSTVGPSAVNPAGVYTHYAADIVAPSTAAFANSRFGLNAAPPAGRLLYADDVTFTRVTPNAEAECTLYLSVGPTIGTKLGTTRTGSTGDTFGFAGLTIPPGLGILAVWEGGEPGTTATLGIFGTKGRFAT